MALPAFLTCTTIMESVKRAATKIKKSGAYFGSTNGYISMVFRKEWGFYINISFTQLFWTEKLWILYVLILLRRRILQSDR